MTAAPVYCRAALNYSRRGAPVAFEMDILDGRGAELEGWEACGFELMAFPSSVRDWHDLAEVEAKHYDEVTRFCRALTGCSHVIFYPPLLRSPEAAAVNSDLAPIEFVHSDYTESYRAMIGNDEHPYHRILEPSMARAGVTANMIRSASRVLTLQLWRNIGEPEMDRPLCFCDCRTVARTELTPIRVAEYGGLRTEFDAFAVRPRGHEQHLWYTFPNMTVDEAVVFRAFDSLCVDQGRPFWSPHTSFRDPNRSADASARRSVEMRAICIFP